MEEVSFMKIRVYYEDTDCGNVVYYANYLKYMERSRTELLRDSGINLSLLQKRGYIFIVTEVHLKYKASAKYDDLLDVDSIIKEISFASITFYTTIKNAEGKLLVTGDVKLAYINSEGKICRLPEEIAEILTE